MGRGIAQAIPLTELRPIEHAADQRESHMSEHGDVELAEDRREQSGGFTVAQMLSVNRFCELIELGVNVVEGGARASDHPQAALAAPQALQHVRQGAERTHDLPLERPHGADRRDERDERDRRAQDERPPG